MRSRKAGGGIRLAAPGAGAARQLLPALSSCVQTGALCREQTRNIGAAGQRRKALAEERTLYLVAYLSKHPCVDCGEDDPIVLEFDHLRDKKFAISAGLQSRPWQDVLDEIAKCDVVCANCHRR